MFRKDGKRESRHDSCAQLHARFLACFVRCACVCSACVPCSARASSVARALPLAPPCFAARFVVKRESRHDSCAQLHARFLACFVRCVRVFGVRTTIRSCTSQVYTSMYYSPSTATEPYGDAQHPIGSITSGYSPPDTTLWGACDASSPRRTSTRHAMDCTR